MTLVSKHGQRYACELPWDPSGEEDIVEEEGHSDVNITALLLPLKELCLIKVQ